MDRVETVLDFAIEATAQPFLQNPANYSDERALAEEVRSRVCSVLPPAPVGESIVEESSGAQGDVPDHEAYTGKYRDVEQVDRAHCEIGGPAFPFSATERLDLGVFDDDLTVTVTNGTQEFEPSDLVAAGEFKYVKNINYLRYRPDDEGSKYRDIAEDISRLGELPGDLDRRCVVFANYDFFRRAEDAEARDGLESLAADNDVSLRFVLPGTVG